MVGSTGTDSAANEADPAASVRNLLESHRSPVQGYGNLLQAAEGLSVNGDGKGQRSVFDAVMDRMAGVKKEQDSQYVEERKWLPFQYVAFMQEAVTEAAKEAGIPVNDTGKIHR